MKIVDLYAGVGGGSEGFRQAGYEPAFACDTDENARLILANNFRIPIKEQVATLEPREVPYVDVLFAAPPSKDLTGIVRLLDETYPRAFVLEFPVRMIDREKAQKKKQFDIAGYKCWHAILNSADYGLAQKRQIFFIVGFRDDVKSHFQSFPFPEPNGITVTLASIFEQNPDPKLFIKPNKLQAVMARNEKNIAAGTGFKTQIYTADHTTISLPLSYYKDYRGILVDSGQGPRRLSALECRRLMGFPDSYKAPVSDTEVYRLFAQASCPPVVAAVARELKTWIEI